MKFSKLELIYRKFYSEIQSCSNYVYRRPFSTHIHILLYIIYIIYYIYFIIYILSILHITRNFYPCVINLPGNTGNPLLLYIHRIHRLISSYNHLRRPTLHIGKGFFSFSKQESEKSENHMDTPSTSTSSIDPKTPVSKLLSSSYRRPSSSRTIYSDRFIPSRSSSNFALFNLPNSSANASSDDSHSAYTNLLKSALFGPECVGAGNGFQPLTPEKSSSGGRFGSRNSDGGVLQISPPNCNIFKYKTETRKSLHSLSPFGFDDPLPGVSHSPVKAPRKVPRSPYKVRFVSCYYVLLFSALYLVNL